MTGIFRRCVSLLLVLPLLFSAQVQGGQVIAGNKSAFYVDGSGELFAWGANGSAQLGDATQIDRSDPVLSAHESAAGLALGPWVKLATNLTGISGGTFEGHALAIDSNGRLWAWGDNSLGQLGQGDTVSRLEPVRVGSAASWIEVEVGSAFSMALNDQGEIWLWGDNRFGQLGPGVIGEFQSIPKRLADKDGTSGNNDTWIDIAAGAEHALAIHGSSVGASYGYLYAWGRNSANQLGLGAGQSSLSVTTPTRVGTSFWQQVEGGITSSFGISSSKLYAWGEGGFGSLGLGPNFGTSIQQAASPQLVALNFGSNIGFSGVSAGSSHTLAWKTNGQLYVVGQNASGQLGIQASSPQVYNTFQYLNTIPGFSISNPVIHASAGRAFSLILLQDGSVLTTGTNDRGQLGNGTNDSLRSFTKTSLGSVDLQIEEITITTNQNGLSASDTLDFQMILRNNGTGTVSSTDLSSIDYAAALSPSTIQGAEGETPLDNFQLAAAPYPDFATIAQAEIAPASAITVRFTSKIPNPIFEGDYYLLVAADVNNVIEEASEENNRAFTGEAEKLLFRADLAVEVLSPTASDLAYDASLPLPVQLQFSNLGTGSIREGTSSAYRLFLSEFEDAFVGEIYELTANTGFKFSYELELLAGAVSGPVAVEAIIPDQVNLGLNYFLGAGVDSGDAITESNEENNFFFTSTNFFQVLGVELFDALDRPSATDPQLTFGGDANWFGKSDVLGAGSNASDIDYTDSGDAAQNPPLEAGETASFTFYYPEPREVRFRRKAETSSPLNRLFFGENGNPIQPEDRAQSVDIFGNVEWEEVGYIIPKDRPFGFFFEQGVSAPGDKVFVDQMSVSAPITLPDYVIDEIEYRTDEYVLQRDRLTVLVRGQNRGALLSPLPEDFNIKVWLSRDPMGGDANDVILGELNSFQILDNGTRFVYQASFRLPTALQDADYYVLARVDAGNDATGNPVDEYTFGGGPMPAAFTTEDNNWRVSENPGVRTRRLPDLWVTNLSGEIDFPIDFDTVDTDPLFVAGPTDVDGFNPAASLSEERIFAVFIKEPLIDDQGNPIRGELAYRFDLVNRGLGDQVGEGFEVNVYLASDRESALSEANLLMSFNESSGFASQSGRGYEFTTNIPENIEAGRFYYLAITVDTQNQIEESDEGNNSSYSQDRDIFIGEVPLEVALNDDSPWTDIALRAWDEGYLSSVATGGAPTSPWFGQKEVFNNDTTAARAAAQSGPVGVGQMSYMTTDIINDGNLEFPLYVSFRWKVDAGLADELKFEIRSLDGLSDRETSIPYRQVTSADPSFTGSIPVLTEVVDWRKASFIIEQPGDYRLRWSYTEGGDLTPGTAWVDSFSLESPDLLVAPGSVQISNVLDHSSNGLDAGDSFDLDFTLRNNGDAIVRQALIQVRLVKELREVENMDWTVTNFEDVVLVEELKVDLSNNEFIFSSDGRDTTILLPDGMTDADDYFVAIWVDYLDTIPERNESNNLEYSANSLPISPRLTIGDALDFDPDSLIDPSAPSNGWFLSGDGRWFPLELAGGDPVSASPEDPSADALQSPALPVNEQAGFQAIIEGPKLLTFWWRADSRGADLTSEPNAVRFQINGQNVQRELDQNGLPLSTDDESFGAPVALTGTFVDNTGNSDSGWVKEAVFIPTGPQVLSWTYSREDSLDAGRFWVDKISFNDITEADFAVSSVDYTAGSYGLERDSFPLEVKVVNRGATPVGFNYNNLQLNVKLSQNQNPGEGDLHVGTLPLTDLLNGGQQIVFAGDLDFPVNISAGDYYLLIEVKTLDPAFQEYADLLSNNIFVSNAFDVEIVALPRLDSNLIGFYQDKIYFPKETLLLDWELLNIGLGDIAAGNNYTQRIELWSFGANENEFLVSNATFVREMISINETRFLPGALSRDNSNQSMIEYQTLLRMPNAAELLADLGEVDEGLEEEDAQVGENLQKLSDYVFFFVIVRDNELPQSSDLAIRYFPSQRFVVRAVPNTQSLGDETGTFLTYETWRELNRSVFDPEEGSSGIGFIPEIPGENHESIGVSGAMHLSHYALNLPLESAPDINLDAENTFTQAGTYSEQDGAANQFKYRTLTFPILRGAVDLNYIIEVSNDGGKNWEADSLVEIEPPYLDNRGLFRAGYLGAQSLTSPRQTNSLINTLVNSVYTDTGDTNKPVLSVVDQNYTAMVTIRDIVDLNSLAIPDNRTLRLRVEKNNRILDAELELTEPGSGTVAAPDYVKGANGFALVAPAGVLVPGDTMEVNFDVWSIGEVSLASARVQVRLVEANSGSFETLDWSTVGLNDLVLFDGILPLDQTLNSSEYHAFRRDDLVIPENVLGTKSYYVAVWVDYLNEVNEFDESNNLAFSAAASVDVANPLSIADAIDSDLVSIDLDGDPLTVDTITWTQVGDASWFPLYDETPNGGSAPEGAVGDDAVSSPRLAEGQTAKLRTSLGPVPRVIEFNWFSSTSSPDSFISVNMVATGDELSKVSGFSLGWETASVIVPAGVEVEFRYTQGTPNANDRVFIDNFVVKGDLTAPDFVLSGVDLMNEDGGAIPSGSYILEQDLLYLSVNTFNQGIDSPGDFSIEVYLSQDANLDGNDVLIRNYLEDRGDQFLSGNGAVNGFAIDLPNTLVAGSYYLIAVINRAEADINESGRTDNNMLVTKSPVVDIIRRPDLVVRDFDAQPNYFLVEDSSGLRGSLDFSFTIENRGLADVDGPLSIKVLLSQDSILDPDTDYIVLEYTFNGSLAQGTGTLIDPDSVELRDNVPLGEYQFMGAYIDAGEVVTESDETNNGSVRFDRDFVFSLRTLREALDLAAAGPEVIVNDESAPYAADQQPWVAVPESGAFGGDAVTNVQVGNDESSSFSVQVNPTSDVRVSFWWKVSSQNELVEGINQRDLLSFSVDGIEAVAPIFGTENPDWRRVEVPLSAGAHTLTWTYSKDDQGSQGSDRGWVDNLVISELPNLQVSGISLDEAPVYRPDGDTIDTWSVTVTNSGARAIEAGTSFDVAVRLSPSASWSDGAARTLLTITDSAGLAAGASRTYDQSTDGALVLPAGTYADEFYYYGAYADWSTSAGGAITESFEDDNLTLSASAGLQIGLPDMVTTGVAGLAGPYSYAAPYALDVALDNIGEGVLLAGGSFDLRVFLVPTLPPGVADGSQARELGTVTVSGTEVAAGGSLAAPTLSGNLPYGIANGSYYIGVQLDPTNELLEQGPLSVAEGDPRDRPDGEGNNLFFTTTASFTVDNGISLAEALDQPALTIETRGDGTWFSRNNAGDLATADDDQSFVDNYGVQSPVLAAGQSASFAFVSGDTYMVGFDYVVTTGSATNHLSVQVNGEERVRFSGNDAARVEVQVAAGDRISWVYTEGEASSTDAAYVDNLSLTPVVSPDLTVLGLDLTQSGEVVANGRYVLQRDRLDLSVLSRNLGTDVLADFSMKLYLSRDDQLDGSDTLVRTYFEDNGAKFLSGNSAVNGFSIDLPTGLEAGDYHVIAVIDSEADIAEFSELNNVLVTPSASVEIVRLPDLEVSGFEAQPAYYLVEDVTNLRDFLDFEFRIANNGLADADGPLTIRVLLSSDSELDPAADYTVLEYTYNGSLAVGDSVLVDPDAADIRTDVPLGAYQFMGAYIDAGELVTESDETNNGSVRFDRDFVFSLRTLREGLDLAAAGPEVIVNDESAPYAADQQPWVAVPESGAFGGDAVTNVQVGNDESSSFSVQVNPTSDVRVSFWWKVSSQNELVEGINQRDLLSFSVDGVEAVAPIFGTDNPDWRRVEVPLSAGAHTLTWTYSKDDQGSQGSDRGWVDNLVISELPNLQVSGISLDEAPVYRPDGDTIDTWSVTVTNSGARAIEPGTSFDVALRLSPSASWTDGAARTLLTITDSAGLAAGASRTYNQASHGALTLPAGDYADEFYYYGAYADWSTSAGGAITESFEDDNLTLSASAGLQVGLPDVAVDTVAGLAGAYSYAALYALDVALDNIGEGVLLSGSGFDVRVFLVPNLAPGVADSSQARELGSVTVSGTEVAAGGSFAAPTLSGNLPYGIANGSYYIGVQVDPADTLLEQGPLSVAGGDPRDRPDGEGNNLFFTTTASFTVDNGISLAEALDQPTLSIETRGDGTWFSRNNAGDLSTADDDQSFVDNDGVQSPALAAGQSASFSFVSDTSQLVRFDWSLSGISEKNLLSVSVNGIERGSISGGDTATAVEVLVSSGSTVRWTYMRGDPFSESTAYVDNIELVANNLPDLAITAVNYLAGEYVLDRSNNGNLLEEGESQYLQSKYLDVSVTTENQGKDLLLSSGEFTSADIEVRLSLNSVYGDADDIILGSFAQMEGNFSEGNLLSFLGPIALGDHIPEGFYYLMVRIDPNNRVAAEFTEQNNFWVSDRPDVQISLLPDLIIQNLDARPQFSLFEETLNFADIIDVDETGMFYTNGRMRVRFNVQNRGLGIVDGSENFVTQVNLRGIRHPEVSGEALGIAALSDLPGAATDPIILGEFVIQDELLGRNATSPGDVKPVDVEVFLPDPIYFRDVMEADDNVRDYLWFIEVIVDLENAVEETSGFNTWWGVDVQKLLDPIAPALPTVDWLTAANGDLDDGLFGIDFTFPSNESEWEAFYGVTANANGTAEEKANFFAYAFNRNPADGDTLGGQFPGSYGVTESDGDFYLYLAFDILARTQDLQYVVQASNFAAFPVADTDTLLTIRPPFTSEFGPSSLTGDGGLIEEPNVLSVVDNYYSARIMVRDNLITPIPAARFMRVVVNPVEVDGVSRVDTLFVIPEMLLLGVSADDPDVFGESDYDGDSINNFLELVYGSDPTDVSATPTLTAEDEFVANQLAANGVYGVGAALSGDFDGDGIGDLIEIIAGSHPGDSGSVPSAEANFVAVQLASLGVLSTNETAPGEDFDGDGVSNLIELLFGFNPTDSSFFPVLTAQEVFVAEQMSRIGTPGYAMAGIGPDDDFDGDSYSNVVELLSGTNPTIASSLPTLTALEIFVIEQLADAGVLLVNAGNLAPNDDYDADGVSNIAEILYGTSPNDNSDLPVLSELAIYTAEQMALAGAYGVGLPNVGPFDDFDGDGTSNIDELNAGTDPTAP